MKTLLTATVAATGLLICACSGHSTATPTATVTIHPTPVPSQPSTPGPAGQTGQTQTGQGAQPQQPPVVPANAPGTSAVPPGCLSRYLYAKLGPIQGTPSRTYLVIQIKNLDNVRCSMYGYPGVALDSGLPVTQVGLSATENPATPRELITLKPHRWASALLQIGNVHSYPAATCHPVTTHGIQVIPPNQFIPLYLPYTTQTCAKNIRTLMVDAVRPGPGGSV
jgi:hypothetical protein